MKNALILHGTCDRDEYFSADYPSLSNSHWLPWLQKQLLIKGIHTQTPEMPDAWAPNYVAWKSEFERYPVDDDTILIGHSCGGGFLVRWLSENKIAPKRVILVAPWLDPFRSKTGDFFDFSIDPDLGSRTELHIFNSTNDDEDIQKSISILKAEIRLVTVRDFQNYGHFCFGDMKTTEFPELLATAVPSETSLT